MSFSFVVNGHQQENMTGEEEMQRVQALVEEFMTGAEDVGIHIRIDAFNPPSWAPTVQENFQQSESAAMQSQGSVGDTGEGSMGVPPTQASPDQL